MYNLQIIVATGLVCIYQISDASSTVTVPSEGNKASLHYDYAPQKQQEPVLDSTWVPEVTKVEPGPLVGVELAWPARGWTGVEYLVSWAQEGGMISGHLVTKDTKAEVSFWPGMKYYVQIELLDFQGNTMMKSHAAPLIFQMTSVGTTTTSSSSTEATVYAKSITSDPIIRPATVSIPSSHKIEYHLVSFRTEPSTKATTTTTTTPSTTTTTTTTTTPSTTTSSSTSSPSSSTTNIPSTTTSSSLDKLDIHRIKTEESKNVPLIKDTSNEVINDFPSRIHVLEAIENHREEEVRVDVLQIYEVDGSNSVDGTPSMSAMVVWGAGVAMGALLVLFLCVLALWILRKSRKTKVPTYLEDSVLSSSLSSSEKGEHQIKSSWQFETFSGSPSKENLVAPQRAPVHYGIDNASLFENYIIANENPYHSRPLPPLPPVREIRY